MWHRRGGLGCFPFGFYGAHFGFTFHPSRRWRGGEEYREELQEELREVEREIEALRAQGGRPRS